MAALDRKDITDIDVAYRRYVVEDAAHVEFDVCNKRSVYVTTAGDCTSVVLVGQNLEEQASIVVESGELETARE